jgi:hypothetical protein
VVLIPLRRLRLLRLARLPDPLLVLQILTVRDKRIPRFVRNGEELDAEASWGKLAESTRRSKPGWCWRRAAEDGRDTRYGPRSI